MKHQVAKVINLQSKIKVYVENNSTYMYYDVQGRFQGGGAQGGTSIPLAISWGCNHPPGPCNPLICSQPPDYWHASYLIKNNLKPYQYDRERQQ